MAKSPRLRTVHKSPPAFPLNQFPHDFPYSVGRDIVYLLAVKGRAVLIGAEWEKIFADAIGANWRDSNVGLDDIRLGNTAWGAKTVISNNPIRQSKVRLISGRNSIVYSFESNIDTSVDPNLPGEQVLSIWNDRVAAIRERFDHLRTVVMIKSPDLSEVVIFEFETFRYDPEMYQWRWNRNRNLEGFLRDGNVHKFTWQPHGSQFTIHEDVPDTKMHLRIRAPQELNKEVTLQALGFDNSWITVTRTRSIPEIE